MSQKPHSTVEQALRSLTCSLQHLSNANANESLPAESVDPIPSRYHEYLAKAITSVETAQDLLRGLL